MQYQKKCMKEKQEEKEQEAVPRVRSLFGIYMCCEKRYYENTSGLDASALCKAYGKCELPFVEMGQYGRAIGIEEYAEIEQSDEFDFSVFFDADNDEISIWNGEESESQRLQEMLEKQKEQEAVKN